MRSNTVAALLGIVAVASPMSTMAEDRPMGFFVTSEGMGNGGDITLTARDTVPDRIRGLDAGAATWEDSRAPTRTARNWLPQPVPAVAPGGPI